MSCLLQIITIQDVIARQVGENISDVYIVYKLMAIDLRKRMVRCTGLPECKVFVDKVT